MQMYGEFGHDHVRLVFYRHQKIVVSNENARFDDHYQP